MGEGREGPGPVCMKNKQPAPPSPPSPLLLPDHVYLPNGDDNENICACEEQIGLSDRPDRVYSLITFKVIDSFSMFNQPKR